MSVNILVPSTPRHLKVTPTMIDDFLIDPNLGARKIMGVHLDAFQSAALKLGWWYPWFMDESGLGTGKSLRMFLLPVLRCLLIEDQVWCICYQTLDIGKRVFWQYFTDFNAREAPIFNAQLGKVDTFGDVSGKDNVQRAACLVQHFKNGSRLLLPAPNWFQQARSMASDTFNGVVVDEWTKIEDMTKTGDTVGGLDKQVLGRVRRKSWNQYHRLWCNKRIMAATAESPAHRGFKRRQAWKRRMDAGDPDYFVFTSNFKDFSNLPSKNGKPFRDTVPDWKMLQGNKNQWTEAHFRREALGLWSRDTKGWYTESALNRCVEIGASRGLEPECSRNHTLENVHYFMGVDSAPAQSERADDGAIVTLRVRPKPGLGTEPTANKGDWLREFVWAYRVRGNMKRIAQDEAEGAMVAKTTRHWSGLIHHKHRHFGLNGLMLDPQAGGAGGFIMADLANTRQLIQDVETEVTPIASFDDTSVGNADFILRAFRRRDVEEIWPVLKGDDNLIHAAHAAFQEDIEHGEIQWPMPFNERPRSATENWEIERQWALKNLDAMRQQLMNIAVELNDDGTWRTTQNNALRFHVAHGKKDLAYAGLMAYVRFLLWLKLGDMDGGGDGNGDDCIVVQTG